MSFEVNYELMIFFCFVQIKFLKVRLKYTVVSDTSPLLQIPNIHRCVLLTNLSESIVDDLVQQPRINQQIEVKEKEVLKFG